MPTYYVNWSWPDYLNVLGMYYCAIMFGPIFTHVRFLSSVQYPVPDYYGQKGIALLEKLILFF